ncbi:MAG: hypothetical protein MUF00_14420 [Gemmatimonadaceae bacterium]|jgi:hypothetical protein|nr:hypothetical protein [Gemmatimonadaceae bacterium]
MMVEPRLELSELAERFLLAMLERLPLERISELHLFQPMRQGGVETGIAVVAFDPSADDEVADVIDRRHTVFTARYRATLKGPERGRWETDLVAEADAPLAMVETVVRGVQRRSGDELPPTRLDAAQVARALRLPVPARYHSLGALASDQDGESQTPPHGDSAVTDGFMAAPLADLPPAEHENPEWPDPA